MPKAVSIKGWAGNVGVMYPKTHVDGIHKNLVGQSVVEAKLIV